MKATLKTKNTDGKRIVFSIVKMFVGEITTEPENFLVTKENRYKYY